MNISQVSTAAGSIAVEVAGNGPLVLCSPGMGEVRSVYAPLARALEEAGFRVAAADLRGHGDSSTGFGSYGDEATADDLLAVIEQLGGPALIIGTSMSAASAVIAAGRRPDLVTGLVLAAPFLRNGAGAVASRLLQIALLRPWGPWVWRMYFARLWPGLDNAKARAAELTALLTRPGRWSAFRATAATNHDVVRPWLGGKVRVPVLVVMGDGDPDWKDPRAEAEWVAAQFADARLLMVPGSGHAPMLERPETVSPAVTAFASAVAGGRGAAGA